MDKFFDILERTHKVYSSKFNIVARGTRKKTNMIDFEEWYDSRIELFNSVLLKLLEILYKRKDGVGFLNVDSVTGRILVPVPWGSMGYKLWGLKSNEASVLKRILLVRSESKKIPPLFDYSADTRNWFVNFQLYPTGEHAIYYIKSHPITMKEFSQQYKAYKNYIKDAVDRHEKKG